MMVCLVYWEFGRPDQALSMANESVRLGELAGFMAAQVLAGGHRVVIYGNLGALEQGLQMARQAVTIAETHFPHFRCHPLGILAQLHLAAGNLTEAETLVEQGRKDPYVDAHPNWNMRIHFAEAELALTQGDYEQAITFTDHWLLRLREHKLRTHTPAMLHLKGQVQLAAGQADAARESWLEARDIATATGSRATLWPILFALSRLEPDPTEAKRLHRQARDIVETIAGHIGAADLQASFLNLPAVRDLF
jgi:tetratricopeptide (TPR) repeat protein